MVHKKMNEMNSLRDFNLCKLKTLIGLKGTLVGETSITFVGYFENCSTGRGFPHKLTQYSVQICAFSSVISRMMDFI